MKKFKKFAVILALVQLLAAVGLFAACNNGEEQGGGLVDGMAVVTFDPNLDGTGLFEEDVTSVRDQTVEPGSLIVNMPLTIRGNPANPQNLGFKEWCVDREGTTPWDFSQPVTESMTLYAKWESQLVVTYYIGDQTVKENLFSGEYAEPQDDAASWNRVLGWYTDAAYTQEYDFSQPVTENLDLYCKLSEGVYISAERFESFNINYGDVTGKATDTTIEYVDDGEEDYAKVHFGMCSNTSYIYYNNFNQNLADPLTGERTGDYMTITYKNLGPATHIRFYYVVGYDQVDENGTHYYLYSGAEEGVKYNPNADSTDPSYGVGQWRGGVNGSWVMVEIESNMEETDDWATVSIDLNKATIMSDAAGEAAGESEWGTADILRIPRWEAVIYDETNNTYTSDSLVNIVWFRGIEFTAVPETGDNA